jgi:hypothetical protein
MPVGDADIIDCVDFPGIGDAIDREVLAVMAEELVAGFEHAGGDPATVQHIERVFSGGADDLATNVQVQYRRDTDKYLLDDFVFEGAVGVELIAGQDKVTDHDLINTFRSVDG